MATAASAVTAWDENGNPAKPAAATAWDENGNPVSPARSDQSERNAEALKRVAQPTEFEKTSAHGYQPTTTAGKVSAGAEDLLKGVGEGALQTVGGVSRAIHAIPGVGETLAPLSGMERMRQLATPANTMQRVGAGAEQLGEFAVAPEAEGATLPVRAAIAAGKGGVSVAAHEAGQGTGEVSPEDVAIGAAGGAAVPLAGPTLRATTRAVGSAVPAAARYAEENVLPMMERLPVIGHAMKFADDAPTLPRAIVRGATAGGTLGAGEGLIYGHPIRRAVEGAALGGASSGLLHGVTRLAGIPPVEPPEEEPFALTSENPARETAVQNAMEFPKPQSPKSATNPNPFRLTPDEPVSEPAVQQHIEFPRVAGPKEAPAVRLPEPEAPTEKPLHTDTQDLARRIDEATGNAPVVKGVPLREQPRIAPPKAAESEAAAAKSLAEKYPDKAQRQLVHANGEEIYKAAKGNPEVMKQIHALSRVDLRQALINAGEDMGQTTVSDSRFAGPGSITRQQAFGKLLDKGYTPEQIVDLGRQSMGAAAARPPAKFATMPLGEYEHAQLVGEENQMRRGLQQATRERARRIRTANYAAHGESLKR